LRERQRRFHLAFYCYASKIFPELVLLVRVGFQDLREWKLFLERHVLVLEIMFFVPDPFADMGAKGKNSSPKVSWLGAKGKKSSPKVGW